ncbi:hypothetical protein [Nitrosopumilus sp.]|uniref:hypothetical protein n=1 Tax=Nitrosopumilus sp. TaxID=2024843 RepID=UPI003D136E7C
MPEKKNDVKEEGSKWITVNGRKVEVKPDESAEDAIREKLPKDTRGEKEKNTKEAVKKSFVKRYNVLKSKFNLRDEVVFDNFEKSGTVCGIDVGILKIFSKGTTFTRQFYEVFKKAELVGEYHWDMLSRNDRLELTKASGVGRTYIHNDWSQISPKIQTMIQKGAHPAGYSGSTSTTTVGVYNPVNDDKTISQRIKEAKGKNGKEKESD